MSDTLFRMKTLTELWLLLWSHRAEIAMVVVALTALWQRQPESWRLKMEEQYPRLVGFVRLGIAVWPALRDAYLAIRYQIVLGVPKEEVLRRQEAERPLPSAPKLPLVVMLLLAAFLSGCPRWEREVCGSPRTFECRNDQPHRCSPTGWTPIGDEPCGATGSRCIVMDGGRQAACEPIDAGAQ